MKKCVRIWRLLSNFYRSGLEIIYLRNYSRERIDNLPMNGKRGRNKLTPDIYLTILCFCGSLVITAINADVSVAIILIVINRCLTWIQ